jgi:hypothetical protein
MFSVGYYLPEDAISMILVNRFANIPGFFTGLPSDNSAVSYKTSTHSDKVESSEDVFLRSAKFLINE